MVAGDQCAVRRWHGSSRRARALAGKSFGPLSGIGAHEFRGISLLDEISWIVLCFEGAQDAQKKLQWTDASQKGLHEADLEVV